MVKKIIAAALCMLMIAMCVPFTVSAAENASFKICVASQDSKSVVVTIDFAGGTGFSAFDADIKYNNLKLSLEDCQFASGFAAFKQYSDKEQGAMIFNVNSDINPVKVSIASTIPFKAINKDGAILKLKFSKIEGANIAESDISLDIQNCQDSVFTDIKTSVAYDLTAGSSSSTGDTVIEAGKLPEEEAQISDNGVLSTTKKESDATGEDAQIAASAQDENNSADASSIAKQNEQTEENLKADKGLSNSRKTIVIIVIAIVGIGGVAALAAIIIKNKKSSTGIDD